MVLEESSAAHGEWRLWKAREATSLVLTAGDPNGVLGLTGSSRGGEKWREGWARGGEESRLTAWIDSWIWSYGSCETARPWPSGEHGGRSRNRKGNQACTHGGSRVWRDHPTCPPLEVMLGSPEEGNSGGPRYGITGPSVWIHHQLPVTRDRVSRRQDSDIWGWVLLDGGDCPVGCRQFNGVSGFSPPEARSIPLLPSSDNQNTPRRCPVSPGHGGVGGRVGKAKSSPCGEPLL